MSVVVTNFMISYSGHADIVLLFAAKCFVPSINLSDSLAFGCFVSHVLLVFKSMKSDFATGERNRFPANG